MNYRGIIAKAYRLTKEHPRLHWFGFWPAVLDISVGGTILLYQGTATLHHFFRPSESWLEVLSPIFDFVKDNFGLSTLLAIIAGILFLLRIFVPVVCEGGLIISLDAIRKGNPLSGGRGLMKGILIFLPLFELTIITGVFSLQTILVEMSFAYRNLPIELFEFVSIPMVLFMVVAILASLAMIYAKFYLILDRDSIRHSIAESFRLVYENLWHTIIVGLLMLTIALRILISVLLVVLIPLAMAWLSTTFLLHLQPVWALSISGGLSLGLLYFSGRLLGAIQVLVTSAWALTYWELRELQKKEDGEVASETIVESVIVSPESPEHES